MSAEIDKIIRNKNAARMPLSLRPETPKLPPPSRLTVLWRLSGRGRLLRLLLGRGRLGGRSRRPQDVHPTRGTRLLPLEPRAQAQRVEHVVTRQLLGARRCRETRDSDVRSVFSKTARNLILQASGSLMRICSHFRSWEDVQ